MLATLLLKPTSVGCERLHQYQQKIFVGLSKGAFNNYVDKKGWVDCQPIVYVCLCGVGEWVVSEMST